MLMRMKNVSFTSLVSLHTSKTQANHQLPSHEQFTNPACLRWSNVSLALCYLREVQMNGVFFVPRPRGLWRIVQSIAPNYFVLLYSLRTRNELTAGMLAHAQSNNCHGVITWSLYGFCRLAWDASCFTVPPRPSHAPGSCQEMPLGFDSEILLMMT